MAFMLEAESGAEKMIQEPKEAISFETLEIDKKLELSLNQMLFKKYFNLARLQASVSAKVYSENRLAEALEKDKNIIQYGKYLQNSVEDTTQLN